MTKPLTIRLIDNKNLIDKVLNDDEALIILDEVDETTIKEVCPDDRSCVYIKVPIKDAYTEPISKEQTAELVCSLDISVILDFVELCRGMSTLYISDDIGLEKAWAVALGVSLYIEKDSVRDTLFKMGSRFPDIEPRALQIVEMFDLELKTQGKLIDVVEEYMTTGKLVKVGHILNAAWVSK